MKGDFSRITFDPSQQYSRVLMQQGRVQLDSDWNEQGTIVMAAVRMLARDLLGPHCGSEEGFKISPGADGRGSDLSIGVGWYYVDGIRCQNRELITTTEQPGFPFGPEDELREGSFAIAYLDVWERHVTAIEDPSIREVALGGPDTATRARVTWRVRLHRLDERDQAAVGFRAEESLRAVSARWRSALRARAGSPGSKNGYEGQDNQLYRVEVHEGGTIGCTTFKWSRDNGSVAAAVLEASDESIKIDPSLLRPGKEIKQGDWVELGDDDSALRDTAVPLAQVESVDGNILRVSEGGHLAINSAKHPLIRRWDHGTAGQADLSGAVPLEEDSWLDLEQGVQVWFEEGGSYRSGDYWLIPARTATADVEWAQDAEGPSARPPAGVRHHLAPLALVRVGKRRRLTVQQDLRRVFRIS